MEIRICSHLAASVLLQQQPGNWDVIVVLDSKAKPTAFVEQQSVRHLFLRFDDVVEGVDGRLLVTSDQIEAALEFARLSERLVVTCHAGQSRSAALAYIIACQKVGVDAAIHLISPKRHVPNRLVVHLGAAALELPECLARFIAWRDANANVSLATYYDEMESEVDELEAVGWKNEIVSE